jgi:hypothetical protein
MHKKRFAIFLLMAFSFLLGTMAAQDEGQYLILSAHYGNEHNHVDVTNRLKELARADRPFQVNNESMAADPARGEAKMLRVFARGPNGQERSFDFPDNSTFDGRQFRAWGRGEWGDEHWNGGWNGRAEMRGNGGGGDEGQFVILSAQYGTKRRHIDVTNQLREMARRDISVRLDYKTFGEDPARGHAKVLRIYARGPNGHERMFEYQDNSIIDGTQFRGWGRGEWGNGNDHWSGRWDVEMR